MGERAPKGKLVIRLEAVPNEDYTSPDEPLRTIRVHPLLRVVDTLREAVEVALAFQKGRRIGYGNWAGGEVYDEAGDQVAYVAYGGSVWEALGSRRPVDVRNFDMGRRVASTGLTAERWSYWDFDELDDAFQAVQMDIERAADLVEKEKGLLRKFKDVLPKVSDVVLTIGNARDRVVRLRDEIRHQKGLAGHGGKPGWDTDPEVVLGSRADRIASRLVAVTGAFTVMKPVKLRPEAGVTRFSLENARAILEAGYKLEGGYLTYDTEKFFVTTAFFSRGEEHQQHDFKGFSIGYGGEGPHGMMEFGKIFGWTFSEDGVFGRKHVEGKDPGAVDLRVL